MTTEARGDGMGLGKKSGATDGTDDDTKDDRQDDTKVTLNVVNMYKTVGPGKCERVCSM